MTIETRATIELGDIKAVEFECSKCKTKTVRLLNSDFNLPGICGNCQQMWMVEGQDSNDMRVFLNLLTRYAAVEKSPYRLRFEVAGLPDRK